MIFSFWHLTKKLISSFAFLSLYSNFSNLRITFKTSPLYLFRTIDEIDSFLGNRILAKNKKTKTATLKNVDTFQVEQTTIPQEISYELKNGYNFHDKANLEKSFLKLKVTTINISIQILLILTIVFLGKFKDRLTFKIGGGL